MCYSLAKCPAAIWGKLVHIHAKVSGSYFSREHVLFRWIYVKAETAIPLYNKKKHENV